MSENAAPSPPPQTTNVFVDRPCLKCGYNLRGQTATWNRRALNWQVTCPECGGAQVVALGSAERNAGANPYVALVLAVVGLAIAWQLCAWLAYGFASMVDAPAGTARAYAAVSRARPTLNSSLDQDWTILAMHAVTRSVPVILSGTTIGILIAAASYATVRQRNILLVILTLAACLVGGYLDSIGATLDAQTRLFRLQMSNGLSSANASDAYDLKYKVVMGLIALILAVSAGRIGLAVGRPLLAMVGGMYVKARE